MHEARLKHTMRVTMGTVRPAMRVRFEAIASLCPSSSHSKVGQAPTVSTSLLKYTLQVYLFCCVMYVHGLYTVLSRNGTHVTTGRLNFSANFMSLIAVR